MNNGDETFVYKRQSATSFLDFVGESRDSVMYKRAERGYGVYGVKVFDFGRSEGEYLLSDEEAGLDADLGLDLDLDLDADLDLGAVTEESTSASDDATSNNRQKYREKVVAIFVLDARTNKTPWAKGFGGWFPNYEGDFLGERQWQWFENSIRKSNASVNIIVNGLQVHSYRHPNSNSVELWSHFPKSRQRLYDVILQDGVKAPILLSGDVHMAQFLRKDCISRSDLDKSNDGGGGGGGDAKTKTKPLIEFTSSGMTHRQVNNEVTHSLDLT